MRTLLLLACALLSGGLYAQINSFPYSQSFESAFTTGHRTEFLPNWWGNYVVTDTMGQYTDVY
ncbi:MAG: hypothetical protein MUE95_11640 [Cyclobacteriaceae bacterium]|nr:hypothetical protein [Cyclobacteriaceae bacterium]